MKGTGDIDTGDEKHLKQPPERTAGVSKEVCAGQSSTVSGLGFRVQGVHMVKKHQ